MKHISYDAVAREALNRIGDSKLAADLRRAILDIEPGLGPEDVVDITKVAARIRGETFNHTEEETMPRTGSDGLTKDQRRDIIGAIKEATAADSSLKKSAIKKLLLDKFNLVVPCSLIAHFQNGGEKPANGKGKQPRAPKQAAAEAESSIEENEEKPIMQLFRVANGKARILIDLVVPAADSGRIVEQLGRALS